MIIYGRRDTLVAKEYIPEKCQNCGKQNTMSMSVFQKYAHFFWIPAFPIGKTGATECSHCKQIFKRHEFSDDLEQNYKIVKANAKIPVWTFTGLILFSTLVIFIAVNSKLNSDKNSQMILSPQKGDVYEIEKAFRQYTLYKVHEVAGDTVYLLPSKYEVNRITGLITLKNKGNEAYGNETFPLLKNDLKIMFAKGEIRDINREETSDE